ncbi:MAG: EAL domain-containing protein [Lachnospira sp.]
MKEHMKRFNTKKFSAILVVLAAILVTIFVSSYRISYELEEQLQQNLEDVASQNAVALHNKIHSNYELLLSLSNEMHGVEPDNIEEKLQSLEIFLSEYNLKRFAYIFPDGTSYSTDGRVGDLSFRGFFKRGMEGKATITGILRDALEEKHDYVNVMTVPVFDDSGDVEGVFGLTFSSQNFNDALQIDCFDGEGYSCAINSDGEIVVAMGSDIVQMSENIFTDLLGADERNTETIENLKKQMADNTADGGIFYAEEKNYYHCVPIDLVGGDVTWYMLTIIPSDVLQSRVSPIQRSLYLMAFIVVILTILGVIFVIAFSWKQRNMMLSYAYEDPLTKGANYAKFCADMNKKRDSSGFMVSMDITHFNNINIAAGKSAGDRMIGDIWQIVNDELQGDELAGHVQEDVFSIFFRPEDKKMLSDRLEKISSGIHKKAKELQVKGIYARYGVYEMDGTEGHEDAYSKAQIAREEARTQNDQHYVFYNEMDHERLQQIQQLEERFEESLAQGDFEVWYQPKYSAATGEVVGSEALVRWRDTDGSLISPGIFIPLFERNGMIVKLDEYMFRAVCRQQAEWLNKGAVIYPVSINLSRASLYNVDIVERYRNIIKEYGIHPDYIQLEITESAMEGMSGIREFLEQFRNMGIRILMDDFGTGYSSLATLNMQCFDTLKLDKSLIDHIGDKNGETLLYYVINMGQKLGLHITAEGVESRMQLDFLKENNCDDIQGFLFAKPMPAEEFERILTLVS